MARERPGGRPGGPVRVVLHAPGLVPPAAEMAAGLRAPALEALLARARARPSPAADPTYEGQLFELFGHRRPPEGWPVAPVAHLAEIGPPPPWCLRADPVHVAAGLSDALLREADRVELTDHEARELAAALTGHFAGEAWTLRVGAPGRWYVGIDRPVRLGAEPPAVAAGRGLRASLPRGPDAGRWNAIATEMQMVLHASPVNEARRARGRPDLNAVWLWGEGALPAAPDPPPWRAAWGDDPVLGGLARLAGIPCGRWPGEAGRWLADRPAGGLHLLSTSALARCAAAGDVEGWRAAVRELEEAWFAPLAGARGRWRVGAVELVVAPGRALAAVRGGPWGWWRRRALADLAREEGAR